jgi:hypothetical protein
MPFPFGGIMSLVLTRTEVEIGDCEDIHNVCTPYHGWREYPASPTDITWDSNAPLPSLPVVAGMRPR